MFIFTYKWKPKFSEILSEILLDSPEEIPTDNTYVNMYIDNGNSLTALDNEGNVLEFEGEIER